MRRVDLGAVLALLLVPALLAGCSSHGSGSGRTPGPGASPSGASSAGAPRAAGAPASPGEVGACMRDRGYDVDDSDFAGGGGAGEQVSVPQGVDPDRWTADLVRCSGGAADAPAAQPLPGMDELRREAAACIRAGGFPDYPDGIEDQRTWQPSDADAFEHVAKDCDAQVYEAGTGARAGTGAEAGR
jgi:hypothetical protein